jgi:NADH-quinone oxidoreductase subunit K
VIVINHYIILSVILFSIGVAGAVSRRNIFIVLMSLELMLNAVNLSFVAWSRVFANEAGQAAVFFIIAVAAAEVSVGLAIVIVLYRQKESIDLALFRNLKH